LISRKILRRFQKIVGHGRLDSSESARVCHAYDATQISHKPEVILYPGDAEQVSRILLLCNREEIPVYPRGAGSGFAGGSVPIRGGVTLAMNRMNRILGVYPEDLSAEVEPGVINGVFRKAVEELGLFYPPDPGSMAFSTLGGNVATGAGGLCSLKYGVTRDYVLGLEAVLATGEIVHPGVRTLKGVTGYDLTRLLVGSEGTLAVITKITLKLIPKPETKRTAWVSYTRHLDAGKTVSEIIASRIVPSALEFMDENCIHAVKELLPLSPPPRTGAALLIEVDGTREETDRQMKTIGEICRKHQAKKILTAGKEEERDRLWKARRNLSQAINRMGLTKINEDVAVPRSRLPELLDFLQRFAEERNLQVLTFGHAGDGNLHVNILAEKEEVPRARKCLPDLFEEVLRLGGTLSAEHGIGLTKSAFIGMEIAPPLLSAMERIKACLDPKGILNPGKIFPDNPKAM